MANHNRSICEHLANHVGHHPLATRLQEIQSDFTQSSSCNRYQLLSEIILHFPIGVISCLPSVGLVVIQSYLSVCGIPFECPTPVQYRLYVSPRHHGLRIYISRSKPVVVGTSTRRIRQVTQLDSNSEHLSQTQTRNPRVGGWKKFQSRKSDWFAVGRSNRTTQAAERRDNTTKA